MILFSGVRADFRELAPDLKRRAEGEAPELLQGH